MAGSWVESMMVKMDARARVRNTLLVREQRVRSVGKNKVRRGSNAGPRPVASAETRSMAAPESLDRSEFIALLIGRANGRIAAISSDSKSEAPPLQRAVKVKMAFAILSQDSSVSVRHSESRIESISYVRVAIESHYN